MLSSRVKSRAGSDCSFSNCLQMAEQNQPEQPTDEKGEESQEVNVKNSLEDFVTDHYNQQKGDGKMNATDELGEERTSAFFARAIAESRRMNLEIQKSQKKMDSLHAEFGMDMINAWQDEHASEVLQPQEAELVKMSQYQ